VRRLADPRFAFAIAALAALWLAMLLLGGPQSPLDRALLAALRAPSLRTPALLLTRFGNFYVLVPLALVAAAWLAIAGRRRPALIFLAAIASGRILVEAQKAWVAQPRPDPALRLGDATGASFPSAHAANVTVTCLALALVAAGPKYRPAAVAAALLLAFAVGMTRLLLAVHWPSDVIAGWAFGAAWTLSLFRLGGGTPSPAYRPGDGAGN
jgi:undecaprenyl-diphosphatase